MKKPSKPLTVVVGAGCAAVLCLYVPQFEGVILRGYKDPIGIVTACAGHTKTAVLGLPYTREKCQELLETDLVEHAEPVLKCVKRSLTVGEKAAVVSFAFNVGVGSFCSSTMARKLSAKDPTACMELERWVFAGGKVLPGLVKRRSIERQICEGKLA